LHQARPPEQSLMKYNKYLNLMTHINRQTFSAVIQFPMERLGLALPKLSRFADKSMKYATIRVKKAEALA